MVDAKIGDRVLCKIRNTTIVPANDIFEEKKTFEVIGISYQGWYIYCPPYVILKDTVPITQRNYKSLNIEPKFIGWDAYFVTSSFIVEVVESRTGMVCSDCNEYFEYAVPNQEDGTMICFSCRTYPTYKSYVDDDEY